MAGCSVLITDGSKEHHSIALVHEIIGQVGIANHMRQVLLLPAWNVARKGKKKKVLECPLWKNKFKKWLCHELHMTCQVYLLELVLNLNNCINWFWTSPTSWHQWGVEQQPRLAVEPVTAPACWSYSHYPAPLIPAFFSGVPIFKCDALCHLILFMELCVNKEILWF